MPIKGIILLVVFAAIAAWFYHDELYDWFKNPRRETQEEDKESENENEDE